MVSGGMSLMLRLCIDQWEISRGGRVKRTHGRLATVLRAGERMRDMAMK